MYIISKFRDYYDTAATYGIDKSCVYNRKPQHECIELDQRYRIVLCDQGYRINPHKDDREYGGKIVLGFCGEFYPLDIEEKSLPKYHATIHYEEPPNPKKQLDLFPGRKYLTRQEFWESKQWQPLVGLFQQYRTPVFLLYREHRQIKIHLNPCLRDLEFYRVKPAAQTFQEIFQYLSGVLGNTENGMVQISDKKLAEKKGFDDRSFKKEPGQKRGRRKKRKK